MMIRREDRMRIYFIAIVVNERGNGGGVLHKAIGRFIVA